MTCQKRNLKIYKKPLLIFKFLGKNLKISEKYLTFFQKCCKISLYSYRTYKAPVCTITYIKYHKTIKQ